MKFLLHKKSGSVLIEAMVGLSIIILSFGGIIALVSRGFQLHADTLNKFIAVNIASEGIEIVKSSLDTKGGWDAINNGMYVLDYNCVGVIEGLECTPRDKKAENNRSDIPLNRAPNGTYSYDSGVVTPFKRSIVINTDGVSTEVYSIVRWNNRGTEEEVQISDVFKKWRKDPV